MSLDFVRYTPEIETVDPDLDRLLEQIIAFWEGKVRESPVDEGSGRAVRGAHAKTFGVVKAEVQILRNVPPAYAQGIYAKPGRHGALIRFSSASNHLGPDAALGGILGCALKIFDVPGSKLVEDEPDSANRFTRHHTDSLATLARYPYRDDGLLVWNAIVHWAADFVGAYYRTDADVRGDFELQAWSAEIASSDWGQVSDFGATPGAISDRQDLTEILTMVMWTAGPQHAAVNFTQYDYMSFLPANPAAGFSPEPTGTGHTQRDWLAQFPPIDVAIQQFTTFTFLSSVNYTRLGEYGSSFSGTAAEAPNRRFRAALTDVEDKISTANAARAFDYPYLLPSRIPASTNI